MINLKEHNILEAYLISKKLVEVNDGHKSIYCKGGVSGTVVFVDRPNQVPIIIKQALAQLKTKEIWKCDPNRMGIEADSNRIYHDLVPDCAPEVFFYDEENYIYCREAVPADCDMWKKDLMNGLFDFQVAEKSITTLSSVHLHCASDEKIKERFKSKEIFYNLRINPYFEFSIKKHPQLEPQAHWVINQMMNNSITLVHGDYSPKNIMVVGRGISVLDYEVATYGHPAFDLAFFSNHFILKSIKFPQWAAVFRTMLKNMIEIYFSRDTCMDKKELENCYIKTLVFMLIARVDGKSPVEYLVGDDEKQQKVRDLAYQMVKEDASTFAHFLRIWESFN